jgi:hypothetical protein
MVLTPQPPFVILTLLIMANPSQEGKSVLPTSQSSTDLNVPGASSFSTIFSAPAITPQTLSRFAIPPQQFAQLNPQQQREFLLRLQLHTQAQRQHLPLDQQQSGLSSASSATNRPMALMDGLGRGFDLDVGTWFNDAGVMVEPNSLLTSVDNNVDFAGWSAGKELKPDFSHITNPLPGDMGTSSDSAVGSKSGSGKSGKRQKAPLVGSGAERSTSSGLEDGATASKKPAVSEAKRQMNKLAADRYRKKKREQLEDLRSQSAVLKAENQQLTTKCAQLEEEVHFLKNLILHTVKTNPAQPPTPSSSSASHPSTDQGCTPASTSTTSANSTTEAPLESMFSSLVSQHCKTLEDRLQRLESALIAKSSHKPKPAPSS